MAVTIDTSIHNGSLLDNTVLGSKYINPNYLFDKAVNFLGYIFNASVWNVINIILAILSLFFIAVIIYVTFRMFEIREKERRHLQLELAEYAHNQALKREKTEDGGIKNEKWRKILKYISSENSNDWKLAIIEADTMLFDLLTQLGFKGETLGDKLKNVDRDNFRGLNFAWEVHNIRNRIAHEGSSFEVSLHEAKRVIALYEQIFLEFGFI